MAKTLSFALLCVLCVLLLALMAASGSPDNPQEAGRLNNIGVAYMNQQLFEKALKAFEEAAANDRTLEVTIVNRGVALLNLQRVDEAKALLEKAVKDNPKDAHAWYNLGLYYKNSADASAAVDAFHRVTEIDPSDADTWYFLGSTHAQLKQFPEAIAAFERALKLDPHHASAQFGLARAYQQSGQADPAHEAMKKFQYITQNKLGAPISLAYGEQGRYSRAEESPSVVEKVGPEIPVKFVDVTQIAGIVSKPLPSAGGELASFLGSGACFLDYDNDGQIDLLLADNGPEGGLALFHNAGGKFEDVTKKAGLDSTMHATGCTAGDYDNDGFADIVLTASGRVLLLHNEKNGTFKDVTATAGIKTDSFALGVTFIDYDHDGDLDLYVTRSDMVPVLVGGGPSNHPLAHIAPGSPGKEPAATNVMWRNNGNQTFTDVTDSTGLSLAGGGLAAVGSDYNNDRAVDIAATILKSEPHDGRTIFENPREGRFPIRQPWSEPSSFNPLGIAALDFNHDGWMDLAFTQIGPPTLLENRQGKSFDPVSLPTTSDWVNSYGVAAID